MWQWIGLPPAHATQISGGEGSVKLSRQGGGQGTEAYRYSLKCTRFFFSNARLEVRCLNTDAQDFTRPLHRQSRAYNGENNLSGSFYRFFEGLYTNYTWLAGGGGFYQTGYFNR